MKNHHSQKDISEIEFRIQFKEEFGIDYLDAVNNMQEFKNENIRRWQQLLIKYNII